MPKEKKEMGFRNLLRISFFLILCFVLISTTFAQTTTTGTIRGTITDNDGVPLPGVELTAESPVMQGIRIAISSENGTFQFLALVPGTYKVTAKMQGFNTVMKTNVKVFLEFTTRLDIELTPGAIEEQITVVATSPVIDAGKTEVGADFDSEILSDMPTARTFQDVTFMTPGAVGGDLGSNPSIMGASAAENRYIIDGVDTTDPAFGTFGSNIPFNFIDTIEVKTGGYQAEYGGALGGVVNVLVKSGGNEFHGSLFGYFNSDNLSGETPAVPRSGTELGYTRYDVGIDLGGYIIRDKLWFYGAFNPFWDNDKYRTVDGVPGSGITGHNVTEKTFRPYFAGKLSWQIAPELKLTFSSFGELSKLSDVNQFFNVIDPIRYDQNVDGLDFSVVFDWTASPSIFINLLGAYHYVTNEYVPEKNIPHIEDGWGVFSEGYPGRVRMGGPTFRGNDKRTRQSIKPSINWFLGDHQFKVGAEYRRNLYKDYSFRAGPGNNPSLALLDPNGPLVYPHGGGPYDADEPGAYWRLRSWGYYSRNYKNDTEGVTNEFSLYLQDTWNIASWFSVVVGVRADHFNAKAIDRPVDTTELRFTALGNELTIDLLHQISPRIGFTLDPTRTGKAKIFGHYGKFYESVPLDINTRMFGYENYDFFYYYDYPTDAQGNIMLPSWDYPIEVGYAFTSGGGLEVVPNKDRGDSYIHGQYTQEFLFGAEYEIFPDTSIGVKGIYRTLEDVIEDISFDGGGTYILTNPEKFEGINEVTGEPLTFPKPERKYKALEVSLKKKFSNNYQFYISYLLSENKGNHGGLFRQDNQQLDPNITSAWDLPSLLFDTVTGEQVAYGLLNNDRTHQLKVYGSYHVPSGFLEGLVIGTTGSWMSGIPISKLGEHISYGTTERFITPRGSEGRTDSVWWVDLHLEYPFRVSNVRLSAIVDAFNVFNIFDPEGLAMTATVVDQEWSWGIYEDDPDPGLKTNDDYGKPLLFQPPWRLRFGLKLSW
jgi:hypothetical protein